MITIDPTYAIPHSIGHEKRVLSRLMNDLALMEECQNLSESHFYLPSHVEIFSKLRAMAGFKSAEIDLVTWMEETRMNGTLERMGGPSTVYDIYGYACGAETFKADIAKLNDYLARRLAISAALGMARSAFEDGELSDVLQAASGPVTAIHDAASASRPPRDTRAIAQEFLDAFEKRMKGEEEVAGTPTGIPEIDQLLGGMKPQQMGIISARTEGGKSTMATQIAANIACHEYPVLYLILERTEESGFRRAVIQKAGVSPLMVAKPKDYEVTKLDLIKMKRVVTDLIANFYIRKPDSRNLDAILAEIRRYVRKHGVKAVFIDQIGLIRGERIRGENRESELRGISNSIQEAAHEMNLSIIVMSQVNNEGETKGARAIEEDADWHLSIVQEMDRSKDNFRQHLHVLLAKDSHNGHGGTKLPLVLNHDNLKFQYGIPNVTQKGSRHPKADF
jgi:replicative DNA helicase